MPIESKISAVDSIFARCEKLEAAPVVTVEQVHRFREESLGIIKLLLSGFVEAAQMMERSQNEGVRLLSSTREKDNEIAAWNKRFPQFQYRPQDDCVSLIQKNDERNPN